MKINDYIQKLGQQAVIASRQLAKANSDDKNAALLLIATELEGSATELLMANKQDIEAGLVKGLSPALMDRLELTKQRIDAMAEGCRQVAALADPIGEITDLKTQTSGIKVGRMRVPLGVIGIIYESRPNVTIDAAALCLKSANATILRGGSEAIHSNRAIAECIKRSLADSELPINSIQLVEVTDRAAVGELITLSESVDVIIPRGGKSLIERISREATAPVIKHLDGICHVYIDDEADPQKAFAIGLNAKTHRYGVCNAMETLLVHKDIASEVLPKLANAYQQHKVELRGCKNTQSLLSEYGVTPAKDDDWDTEYLAPILSIKIVDSYAAAVAHIAKHSSEHKESIVTENNETANNFLREVDSSSVMVNASTRFADGFEYGLGAEIGISTDKLHARGPVGLEGLTSQKYVVFGDGHIRY